jgi:Ca2+-binding EF-hand superfamily protein
MTMQKTADEQRRHLEAKYKELDVNGDGSITLDEFTKGTQGFAKELRKEVWDSFNTNGDEGLSLDEYLNNKG